MFEKRRAASLSSQRMENVVLISALVRLWHAAACGINVNVSLQWVMRNSLTANWFHQTWSTTLHFSFPFSPFPTLYFLFSSFHTFSFSSVSFFCHVNKLESKWGGRSDMGDEACQNVNRWQAVQMGERGRKTETERERECDEKRKIFPENQTWKEMINETRC